MVDLQGDKFLFVERPVQDGFNQAALDWVDNVAANLQRGYVITIDYGHSGNEFQGSVQVRAQHRHLDSPFEQIGHADITMQVDWTSITRRARQMDCASQDSLINIISSPGSFLPGRADHLHARGRLGSIAPT